MENTIVKQIVFESFKSNVNRATKLLGELSNEDLNKEIKEFKNTGYYVLGHLISVHDSLLPLLGLGDNLYPELVEVFIKNPDKSIFQKPAITRLRIQWEELHTELLKKMGALTTAQWFEKHTAISDEDFAKEPHRNRLNVVLSRVNHLSYHMGQIVLLKN